MLKEELRFLDKEISNIFNLLDDMDSAEETYSLGDLIQYKLLEKQLDEMKELRLKIIKLIRPGFNKGPESYWKKSSLTTLANIITEYERIVEKLSVVSDNEKAGSNDGSNKDNDNVLDELGDREAAAASDRVLVCNPTEDYINNKINDTTAELEYWMTSILPNISKDFAQMAGKLSEKTPSMADMKPIIKAGIMIPRLAAEISFLKRDLGELT